MATTAAPPRMTVEEFLALPYDGRRRWLINGRLREEGGAVTYRNRWHAFAAGRVCYFLSLWCEARPEPRGAVYVGDVGFRLPHDAGTVVGIDVAYVPPDLLAQSPPEALVFEGVPLLAVEVLSPSNRQEDIDEKLDTYRAAQVPLVWLVDTHDRTVTAYRPGLPPVMVNDTQELTADPELPGFRVPAAQLFG